MSCHIFEDMMATFHLLGILERLQVSHPTPSGPSDSVRPPIIHLVLLERSLANHPTPSGLPTGPEEKRSGSSPAVCSRLSVLLTHTLVCSVLSSSTWLDSGYMSVGQSWRYSDYCASRVLAQVCRVRRFVTHLGATVLCEARLVGFHRR